MYDPLHDLTPGLGEPHPTSYWASCSGEAPEDDGPIRQDLTADVVIIGGGYTGLSCALHLAREHGVEPLVLEANQTAWGCSGRNAGFILKSTGRKPYGDMLKAWGEEVMRGIYAEVCEGVDTVNQLISEGIDCDVQESGYIRVAHKPSMLKSLYDMADLQQARFGYQVEKLSTDDLRENYFDNRNTFGGIRYQDGYGLNPLKLAWGYHKLARQAGAKIHCKTPVISWHQENGKQVLITQEAKITASKVVIATNGYTPKNFHLAVNDRTLPVLSQIIVTEPLTEEQLLACGYKTSNVVMDTRALKYYFRKLPDNRLLFGGRGAISGKDAEDPYYANRLLSVLKASFPALSDIKLAYTWSGWISMALDDLPHIVKADEKGDVFYAMGYCGNGVSFSVQAGKRLAELVVGKAVPNLPLYSRPLPKFPMANYRRIGQWAYFHYGQVKDKYF